MSERILRALMQLFAIIAKVDEAPAEDSDESIKSSEGRSIVESLLRTELNSNMVDQYLGLFDEQLQQLHQSNKKKDSLKKRTSVNSVKVLRICYQINKELTQAQKIIVAIRVFEYISVNNVITDQDLDFAKTVTETFNIDPSNHELISRFVLDGAKERLDSSKLLYISSETLGLNEAKQLIDNHLNGEIRVMRLDRMNLLFYKYIGQDELYFNGQISTASKIRILSNGSTIKTSKSKPLYYSDVISQFLKDEIAEKLTFKIQNVSYRFRNGKTGLHPTNFVTESGNLIGIMGGSGTGKSTFLNILNGNSQPTQGNITINGIDIHKEKEKLQGVIGFISQDDLLIEELTVYQNLLFNAQLCFKQLHKRDIIKKVIRVLISVGLNEVRHLRVGSPLDKTISGGQRKRLNIALELIREPSVLFVDEPTSGLSSRDSENIMDLLKELALKGKLVFVVIHQPSSEIFKMFDRLFILDQGGFPIYDGNPIDAVVYFKVETGHVNAHDRECYVCGNVNPEQIFNIIEAKVVDEYGNLTDTRKTTPHEWSHLYEQKIGQPVVEENSQPLSAQTSKPGVLRQFQIFLKRDVLSKLSNRQYIAINFLEAPVLAVLLSFFVKYFKLNNTAESKLVYSVFHNENIPQYLFISVIVALFLGLTVAAEEIIKDRHILKRESFLNLSRSSYLLSKVSVMFGISAIQSLTFVLVGNSILEIEGMWIVHWFILFTTSCFANITGLIISSSFNTAKVIYIIVPLLIIPQLLFSGVIVKFDKLHPFFSEQKSVPWIGNIMTSRWSYEAMAVSQFSNNPIEKCIYKFQQQKSESSWKRDYWMTEMRNSITSIHSTQSSIKEKQELKTLLKTEITKEQEIWGNLSCENCLEEIERGKSMPNVDQFLTTVKKQYNTNYSLAVNEIDRFIDSIGEEKYEKLKKRYINESLEEIVTNRSEFDKIVRFKGELIQKSDPIYQSIQSKSLFASPFYAHDKSVLGVKTSTLTANMLFVWSVSFLLYFVLYFNLLKLTLSFFNLRGRRNTK